MMHRVILTLMLAFFPLAAWSQILPAAPAEDSAPAEQTPTETLLKILEDDNARALLIEQLRMSGQEAVPADQNAPEGRPLANSSRELAANLASSAERFWLGLVKLPPTLRSLSGVADAGFLLQVIRDLGLIITATYVLLLVLRAGARRAYLRIGQAAGRSGWVRTIVLSVSSNLIAVLNVVLAWAAGYVIMVGLSGSLGTIEIRQSLYLNAFLIVEISRVVLRGLLAPMIPELRLIDLPDAAARGLSRWIGVAISILGYGLLLAVPVVDQAVSYLAGGALSTAISLIVVAMAIYRVVVRRVPVANWLGGNAPDTQTGRAKNFLAGIWHIPALLYLTGLFLIVATRPGDILAPILRQSGSIALAVLGAMIVTSMLGRSIEHGVKLPDSIKLRLPALELRLNRMVPKVLSYLRLLVIAAVVLITLDALGFSGISRWLSGPTGQVFWTTALSIAILLLGVFAAWLIFASWIDYRLNPGNRSDISARETTLLTLLRNAATIALVIFTLMFVLSELGINIAPLIASAGVLGLAIGFGAQKFVQDIITGIFIQFENAINVGDYITVGGISGTVEKLTIRSVSLRDSQGTFYIIPFSSVDMVSNYTRDFSYFVCDMGVGYREDTEFVKQAMFDAFDEMKKDTEIAANITDALQWYGLQSFGDSAVVLRARVKTKPGYQWGVGRAYRGALKRIFDERGIEIPFPHQTIYFGEDRDGKSPALNVRSVTSKAD